VIVGDEGRRTLAGGRCDVLLGVSPVDALELHGVGYALSTAFHDDRVRPVAVQQDDLGLMRNVPRFARDGRAGEVNGLSVPPEPDRRCVGTILGRGRCDPDLTHALQPPIDVAPWEVATQFLHARLRTSVPEASRHKASAGAKADRSAAPGDCNGAFLPLRLPRASILSSEGVGQAGSSSCAARWRGHASPPRENLSEIRVTLEGRWPPRLTRELLETARDRDLPAGTIEVVLLAAFITWKHGNEEDAVQLAKAAAAERVTLGMPAWESPAYPYAEALVRGLEKNGHDLSGREPQGLSLDDAVELALRSLG